MSISENEVNKTQSVKASRYVKTQNGIRNLNSAKTNSAMIMCVGDLLGEPDLQRAANKNGFFDFNDNFKFVKGVFEKSDLLIGNLETVISEANPYSMDKHKVQEGNYTRFFCNSPPEYLAALKNAGFDVFALSNNHNLDYGISGIRDTLTNLDKYEFASIGLFNKKQKKYLLINVNGIKIGFLSYCAYFNKNENKITPEEMNDFLNKYSAEDAKKTIAEAKCEGAEFVLVYMHCGFDTEYKHNSGKAQHVMAQEIADAGADYIVGSHSHSVQEYDIIRSADGRSVPVAYSLGNFCTSDNHWIARKNAVLAFTLQKNDSGISVVDEYCIPCYIPDSRAGIKFPIIPAVKEICPDMFDKHVHNAGQVVRNALGHKIKSLGLGDEFDSDMQKTEVKVQMMDDLPVILHTGGKMQENPFPTAYELASQVHELQEGAGYTIAQWLSDHDYNQITVIANGNEPQLIRSIMLPVKMNDSVMVKNYFSLNEKFRLTYKRKSWFLDEDYIPLNYNDINSGGVILFISSSPSSAIKNEIEARGWKCFTVQDLIRQCYRYLVKAPVLRLLADNPGVRAMFYSEHNIAQDMSPQAEKLKEQKIYTFTNRQSIISNDIFSGKVSDYILSRKEFTRDDWLELVIAPKRTIDAYGALVLQEQSGKYLNIANGHRITTDQPEKYENTIYMIGGCHVFGIYNTDSETQASSLQRLLSQSEKQKKYKVENYGCFFFHNYSTMSRWISSIKPKKGDIILYDYVDELDDKSIPVYKIHKLPFPNIDGLLWGDMENLGHPSPLLNQYYAEKLYDYLQENNWLEEQKQITKFKTRQIPFLGLDINRNKSNYFSDQITEKLSEYKRELALLKPKTNGKIGSIVMNCNPFTLGHRYLIEYAANTVEHLFIFVVQEDRSVFPFADRFELIKAGTSDLPNVTVLPSGDFIISSLTFSEYFAKSEIQNQTINPSMDVEIFAKEIAPALGITVRFAGEEPLDAITKQYNDAMQRILPQHGIAFEVIPRKENDGEVISASRVRKLLAVSDFDAIEKLVPKTTLEYLREIARKK